MNSLLLFATAVSLTLAAPSPVAPSLVAPSHVVPSHAVSKTRQFRYERTLTVPSGPTRQACVVLDAPIFAHAASESLDDLRLYAQPSHVEIPFNLSVSDTQSDEDDAATVLHSGVVGGDIVFDLKMPSRPYSAVVLALAAQNFIATATVTGRSATGGPSTALGTFALFDLTAQHLSRSTTLSLQESTFPILHIMLHITSAPDSAPRIFSPLLVQGAVIPPSREAQTLYTPVASTVVFTQRGTDTIATIPIPAHIPVQQLRFFLPSRFRANFFRRVEITATPDNTQDAAATETFSGEISHVQLPQRNGFLPIDNWQAAVDMPLGVNLRRSATVSIRIPNGSAPPLPLAAALLEMRQHQLCFDTASTASSYLLRYGNSTLTAPLYPYAQSFTPAPHPAMATLGPEQRNPYFAPRTSPRTLTERYPDLPDLPWIIALILLGIFGSIALRRVHSRRG